MKVLITTVPFGDKDEAPIKMLEDLNVEYLINPLNKKLTEDQLADMVTDFDIIIAGTEPITKKVMSRAKNLKLISRVGIGLDSVDLHSARERNIKVSYTPDAPAPAVAELTVGLMLSLLRMVHVSNTQMHQGDWCRYFGRRLEEITVGLIGVGRIGTGVLQRLKGFSPNKVLTNDINPDIELELDQATEWASKEKILKESDVISLHIPLTHVTNNLIREEQLYSMKKDAIIINTSRGGIINENDLYNVMLNGHLSGAAIDVFEQEPYEGLLKEIPRCLLTAHMGSMSIDCRTKMEIEATKEAVRFIEGKPLIGEVPEDEYEVQNLGG